MVNFKHAAPNRIVFILSVDGARFTAEQPVLHSNTLQDARSKPSMAFTQLVNAREYGSFNRVEVVCRAFVEIGDRFDDRDALPDLVRELSHDARSVPKCIPDIPVDSARMTFLASTPVWMQGCQILERHVHAVDVAKAIGSHGRQMNGKPSYEVGKSPNLRALFARKLWPGPEHNVQGEYGFIPGPWGIPLSGFRHCIASLENYLQPLCLDRTGCSTEVTSTNKTLLFEAPMTTGTKVQRYL